MSQVRSQDGTLIAYQRSGNGPALILVDGALCSRAFGPSQKLAALLTQQFTVYTYDRRGRGESGNTLPYAVEREIEDLAAVIEAAVVESADQAEKQKLSTGLQREHKAGPPTGQRPLDATN